MLNKQGFNLWANDYNRTVQISEENNLYPFAGYKKILNIIFNEVMQKEQSRVLDIGFGTGVLTSKLYDHGHLIDGLDFSARMIDIAKPKMPNANLMKWDISLGLPDFVKESTYDAIISTYTLHHLSDEDKVMFIKDLLPLLSENGKILIGDISFETREELEICKKNSADNWDEDEFYFIADEMKAILQGVCHSEFYPISHCSGVFVILKINQFAFPLVNKTSVG